MTVRLEAGARCGIAKAPPSKSYAHRLLIAAALSSGECVVENSGTSEDIEATIDCLRGLGAGISRLEDGSVSVIPINKSTESSENMILHCRESGSTLRFLMPVAGALGKDVTFKMEGRLPERPLGDYIEALEKGGMRIKKEGDLLRCREKLEAGTYEIPGNVSSQFISGLLFALPLTGGGVIKLKGAAESKAYADMTAGVLSVFSVNVEKTDDGYRVPGTGYKAPTDRRLITEGDWSGAAFLLAAGAFSEEGVTVKGLDVGSKQGDRRILEILERFGAKVEATPSGITVRKGDLKGIRIDAREIPDLVPVLAVTASAASGETEIVNAGRLRFKETDRLKTTAALINSLGGAANETEDGLIIKGTGLKGGTCESFRDHRIAMSAAVASCFAKEIVAINDAECVRKSFPDFFEVFATLRAAVNN